MTDSPWREYRHAQLRVDRRAAERRPHEDAPAWDEPLAPGLKRTMTVRFIRDAEVTLLEFDPYTPQYKSPRVRSPVLRSRLFALHGSEVRAWHMIELDTIARLILGPSRVLHVPRGCVRLTGLSVPKP